MMVMKSRRRMGSILVWVRGVKEKNSTPQLVDV
jgi:hypothetical protein